MTPFRNVVPKPLCDDSRLARPVSDTTRQAGAYTGNRRLMPLAMLGGFTRTFRPGIHCTAKERPCSVRPCTARARASIAI